MTTITSRQGRYSETDAISHVFEATIDGQVVGALYVSTDQLHIENIEVAAAHRGEGIARELYEAADEALGGIYHDYIAHRTEEGHAFAEAVGGDELDECTVSVCYCSEDMAA